MPADPPASAGSAARTVALLWGDHGRAGRSGLSVRAIVGAAVELADAAGLDALSMRAVAGRLGVGTMSLYTHVPGRAELVELMVDSVLGELYDSPDDVLGDGDWRDALRELARRNWALYVRHPWVLQRTSTRPVLGPHTTLKYEAELRPLDGLGLSDVEMDQVLALVLTHVEGTARARAAFASTQESTGETDEQWWLAVAPVLERLIDPGRFPVGSRVGQAAAAEYGAASSPEQSFVFGLERILDGVAALVAGREPA